MFGILSAVLLIGVLLAIIGVAGAEVGMNEVPRTCCSGMFDLG